MRKTCVLVKPVLVILAVLVAAGLHHFDGVVSAQSSDPLLLPRLAFADLVYVGAFRMPRNAEGGEDFSYGGQHLAYNPARNSLFGSSLHNNVAEVTIPTPVKTTDVNQMPFASYIQPFTDPTEGRFREFENGGPNPAVLAGMLVHGNRLYATGSIYYDALDDQVVTHFAHSTDLSTPSFSGMSQVWETGKAGYVAGYMATIPLEWQSRLGGPALTGQCCIPIASRTSYGPGAFGFDPSRVAGGVTVPASPLLYYTQDHTTLGPWEGSNTVYGGTTAMGGVAVIAGTRTALFIGRTGLGAFCYGHGVSDKSLAGTNAADGVLNCYDPTTRDKGMHAYPYRYQIWAYDLADFAAVKAGSKQPWDVVPYGVWPFDLPIPEESAVRIGGVAYDAHRQLLYVSQMRADKDGFAQRPIIHTLRVNGAAPTTLPLTVALTPNAVPPQPTGALVRWSAAVSGPASTYEYRFELRANGVSSVLRDWSTSSTFDWKPAAAALDARVTVSVRSAVGTATAEYPFSIYDSGSGSTSAPATSLGLTSSLPAPQPAGATIVWTATPVGGGGPMVYKWFVYELGLWHPIGSWSPSNQFTWKPTQADGGYRVSVWVKRASSTAEGAEASAEREFPITGPTDAMSNPRVSSVTLAVNKAAPQPAGSTITLTATPSGGTGPFVYKWLFFNGALWQTMGSWTSSTQFNWTPTTPNPSYRVSVWVKRASSTFDEWEATAELPFAIGGTATGTAPTSSSTRGNLTLTTSVPAPQPAGSTIVWTATHSDPSRALVYKWFVFELGLWRPVGTWSSSNQFTWRPTSASGDYRVSASVKGAETTTDEAEASAELPFAITAAAPGSTPAPSPSPTTSTRVSSLALTTNLAAPQPAGSTIVWTATPSGGSGSLVYKWFVFELGLWRPVGTWTASNQFSWAPTKASTDYRISAWVKNAATTADEAEATADRPYAITASTSTSAPAPAPTAPSARVTSLTLTTNVSSPQGAGSTIIWTATPTGGSGTLVYKWFVYELGLWRPMGTWTASNQFSWTPTKTSADYRISAWVKNAATVADEAEATSERPFSIVTGVITAETSTPSPSPTTISSRVSSLALSSSVPSPQPAGATIVWTATPTGGSGSLVYKWFVFELGLWRPVGTWTASNQFSWTPTKVSADYRISAWVKNAATAADQAEATTERPFAISSAASAPVTSPTPAPSTSTRVSSLALTTNIPSPQRAGSTIVWTATPTGGSGTLVYKWFVYELGLWRQIGSWTASNQFSWTPVNAGADYRVSAWVKNAATTADEAEATTERPFAITTGTSTSPSAPAPTTTSSARVSSLSLTANVAAPQPAGATIVWTATPTGGSGTLVYKWFVYEFGLWRPVGSWTASNQFSWSPTKASADYRVSAWVKNAATTADEAEATAERPFAISGSTSTTAPAPTTSTSAKVTSLTLTTNVPAPQRVGSTIVWTATPTGGSGTLVYKWFVYELGLWRPVGTWTTSNQLNWTPTNASAEYRVSAWVKKATTTADEAEATTERPFVIAP